MKRDLNLTNEQRFKKLFADLNSYEVALLRERVCMIANLTREAIKKNPDSFNGIMWNSTLFLQVCNKIDLHIGLDTKKP